MAIFPPPPVIQPQGTTTSGQSPDPSSLYSGQGLINNLFTPSGEPTSDYWKIGLNDQGGRYPANIGAIRLAPAEYFNLAQQYGFFNELQPEEHQAVMQYINALMHPDTMSDENRKQLMAQIMGNTQSLQNQLAAAGAGQGAMQGAAVDTRNRALQAANAFDANLYGIQGQTQRAQGIIGAVQSQQPNWSNMTSIAGITDQTPRFQSGASAVGGLFGSLAGGGAFGAGGIFGKAAGGAA